MKVEALVPHASGDGVLHALGDVYDLADESLELALRLKDFIVAPAPAHAPVRPDPATSASAPDVPA